jgi:hypothetical protein
MKQRFNGIIVDMTIRSKYDSPFVVEKVVLEWKGFSPVVIENIGQSFQGKGNHSLKINTDQVLKALKLLRRAKPCRCYRVYSLPGCFW